MTSSLIFWVRIMSLSECAKFGTMAAFSSEDIGQFWPPQRYKGIKKPRSNRVKIDFWFSGIFLTFQLNEVANSKTIDPCTECDALMRKRTSHSEEIFCSKSSWTVKTYNAINKIANVLNISIPFVSVLSMLAWTQASYALTVLLHLKQISA